ncbi:uncharacterized protein LAESUDRAFT_732133 [Laetiporus sulphureus 93-53]|uniref:Uncharacterized protein n=1 Tax=Laetiporus sulphureus 93-53 TaxID=1314785 RepID=A0A165BAQ9_9APHY|nr:uncharacterized protein LAESUDRAFT_732133 [Laetiporus sulphureus 93-53]KZT00632.1 hypothetical protein LAESUDRAFT_732133 [Laetiporus sulphureus 93-53]
MPVICRYAGAMLLEIGYGYLDETYEDTAEKVSTGAFETGGAGSTIVHFFPILEISANVDAARRLPAQRFEDSCHR